MKKNYKMKKTISMKLFISELGADFSEHIKDRLLELEVRCVLTRREESNILDIKHVQHLMYDCSSEQTEEPCKKEYVYGQFIVEEGKLYFSDRIAENDTAMEAPVAGTIYNFLSSENMISNEEYNGKLINDSNIDYVIDSLLEVCPEVTQEYLDIIGKYTPKKSFEGRR